MQEASSVALSPPQLSVSIAVVSICGAGHVARCLEALRSQTFGSPLEIVVVYDPGLRGVAALAGRFPGVRFVSNEDQRTPLELASRAISETHGDLVLLTEDHCLPAPDWVERLVEAQSIGRAAVGGRVEAAEGMSSVDWAFYFVDFFRYAAPQAEGPSPSLTVCNVAYRRSHLEAIREVWSGFFHETAVNEALRVRFGTLWLTPRARVSMRRHVTLAEALRERYAFGRLFGCARLEFVGAMKRLYYTAFAPCLPVLLMFRMTRTALGRRCLARPFLRAWPVLLALSIAWSWGEWLGYLSRRRPDSLLAAREEALDTSTSTNQNR